MDVAGLQVIVGANLDELDRVLKSGEQRLKDFGSRLQDIGGGMSKYLTAPILAAGTASFAAYGKIDSLKKGLDTLNKSAAETEAEFKRLQEIAKLPGLGLAEVAKGEVRLRTVGFTAEKAQKAMLAFGNAVASVGGGREEFEGALYGLQQLVNTDFPLAEDLNIIKERIPQITPLLKEAFGTARSEDFRKLGITSEQVIDTILSGLGKLPRAAAGPAAAVENLSDTFTTAGAVIGKSLDQSLGITDKLNALGDAVSGAATQFAEMSPEAQRFAAVLATIGVATGPVLFAVGTLTKAIPTLITGFTALRTAILSVNGALAASVIGLAAVAAYQGMEFLNAPTEADRNLAEQRRYTEEFKKMSKERQAAAEAELRASAQLEAKKIIQAERTIQAITEAQAALRKEQGTNGENFLNFKLPDPKISKAIAENEDKLRKLRETVGTANERLEVFRFRLKGVQEVAGAMGDSVEEAANQVVTLGNTDITDAIAAIRKALEDADKKAQVFGEAFDVLGEKTGILTNGIGQLIELGLSPANKVVKEFKDNLDQLDLTKFKQSLDGLNLDQLINPDFGGIDNKILEIDVKGRLTEVSAEGVKIIDLKPFTANDFGLKVLGDVSKEFKIAEESAKAFGDEYARTAANINATKVAIQDLINQGFSPQSDEVQALQTKLKDLQQSQDNTFTSATEKVRILETAIQDLIANGYSPFSAEVQTLREKMDTLNESMQNTVNVGELTSQMARGTTEAFIDFGVGLATGADSATNLARNMFESIGDMLINLGKSALMAGLGVEAIRKSLQNLQGAPAIAAGAALLALGIAVKAGVKSSASRAVGGGGGGGSAGPSTSAPTRATPTANRPQEQTNSSTSNNVRSNNGYNGPNRIEVYGELELAGDKALWLIRNAETKERRTGTGG